MRDQPPRIAVVTAFLNEDWHSQRLLAACALYGEAVPVDPADLSAEVERGRVRIRAAGMDADCFDAFLLARGLSPRGDADVQFSIYRMLEEQGAVIANRLESLQDAQDKFRTSVLLARAGVPTPAAAAVQTFEEAVAFVAARGESVLKPMAGSLGEGVERVRAGPEGERLLAERIAVEPGLYLQRWVPNPGRDIRVFVVGGRARAAVERHAAPGEFRANMARGATAVPFELTLPIARLAERAAAALRLDYTGIDVVEGEDGPQVIEVNGNPAFDMIFHSTGEDMAVAVAEHLSARALRHRRQQQERLAGREGAEGAPSGAP